MKRSPKEEWLRLAAEARPQFENPPPPVEDASPGFLAAALATWRTQQSAAEEHSWFLLPWTGRAAVASVLVATVCAVAFVSSDALVEFDDPLFPETEELLLP